MSGIQIFSIIIIILLLFLLSFWATYQEVDWLRKSDVYKELKLKIDSSKHSNILKFIFIPYFHLGINFLLGFISLFFLFIFGIIAIYLGFYSVGFCIFVFNIISLIVRPILKKHTTDEEYYSRRGKGNLILRNIYISVIIGFFIMWQLGIFGKIDARIHNISFIKKQDEKRSFEFHKYFVCVDEKHKTIASRENLNNCDDIYKADSYAKNSSTCFNNCAKLYPKNTDIQMFNWLIQTCFPYNKSYFDELKHKHKCN